MKRRAVITTGICIVFAAAALCLPAGAAAAPETETCVRATELAKINEHLQAIEQYSLCLNIEELSDVVRAGVLVDRGNSYSKVGRIDLALADFSRAVVLDPVNIVALNNHGNALRSKERYAEALADFTKALELSPMNTMVYNNRANTYKSMGKYDKAAADLDKAIELQPSNAISYYNRACLESMRKSTAAACDWLGKAIEKGFVEFELIKADKDLENIRGAACYKKLVDKK